MIGMSMFFVVGIEKMSPPHDWVFLLQALHAPRRVAVSLAFQILRFILCLRLVEHSVNIQ
jgi:hypothetical protein